MSSADGRVSKLIKGMRDDPVLFVEKTTGNTPYWYQQEFIRAIRDNRFVAGCWCRQLGKSWIVRMAAIWFAFCFPNSFVMIVSSTEKQAYHFFDLLSKELQDSDMLYSSVVDDLKGSCTLSNGSKIITCAPSERAVRGYSVDFLVLDEADRIDREVIVAALATTAARHGSVVMISTPLEIGSFFYQCFQDGLAAKEAGKKEGETYGYVAFHHNWEVGLKVYREEYIRGKKVKASQLDEYFLKVQKASLPDWEWQQEYEATWADEVGTYYSGPQIEGCIWDKNYKMWKNVIDKGVIEYIGEEPLDGYRHTYYAGMDFARDKDNTVLAICRVLEDGRFKIVYFLEMEGRKYTDQEWFIIEPLRRYNVRRAWADRTGVGDPFVEYLQRTAYHVCTELEKIEPVYLSNPKKVEVFGNTIPLVSGALVQFPNHPRFIQQMKLLKRAVTEQGNVQIEAPKDMHDIHDDYPIAFALMMQCELGGRGHSEPIVSGVAKHGDYVRMEREQVDFFQSMQGARQTSNDGFVASLGNRGRKSRSNFF